MKKKLKIIILGFVTLYFGVGLILFIFQKSLVYFPDNQDFNTCSFFEDSEKINIDGTRMYYKKNSDKLVVFYHGNAGSACARTYLKKKFEKLGLSYIFVEYAGYSSDTNKPTKKLLLKDVEKVNQFLIDKDFSQITVMGESLGTALAIYHSTIMDVDKLLLISPFFSMAEVASNNFRIYPISLLLRENYDNGKWIENSKTKSLEIIHGNIDEIIPIEQSKKLYNKVFIANKKYIEVIGANHNDIYGFDETNKNINQFLVE